WRHRRGADRTGWHRRLQADASRRGVARRRRPARHLGPALGRIVGYAQEPRSVAPDVGHATQPEAAAVAAAPHHGEIHLPGAAPITPVLVARYRWRQGRSLLFGSWL